MATKTQKKTTRVLGVDVGGSGIKGGIVDVDRGELLTDRTRFDTPEPATPDAVAGVVRQLADHFEWDGSVGVTVPAIVRHGVVHSAANIDDSWIGVDAERLFSEILGRPVKVLNDADAAGLAELHFGQVKDRADGVVMLLTFGTGIGSAIFVEGNLLPNSELGHLQMHGGDAEHWASAKVRRREDLSWEEWGRRVNEYLQYVEFLFSPDAIIVGGGVSRRSENFFPYLETIAPIFAAELENRAGVVGAAWYSAHGS